MIRLGLDRVRRALSLLGHPEEDFSSVLVAGTNGKGSVSALIESAARAAGLRTGHYTSPHLVDVRERVRVDGKKVGAAAWVSLGRAIDGLARARRLALTEFERQTLAAFRHFADQKVDLAVVEVGLGGRLDATNALPAPEATVITSIGHDHQAWLGPTLKHVYFEKRGVARPGTPMVQCAPRALWSEGDRQYREQGVPAWTLGREIEARVRRKDWARRAQSFDADFPGAAYRGVEIGLLGGHQARNGALALAVCHILKRRGWPLSEEAVRDGFRRTSWPGRFQVEPGPPDAILDGAHNREAAEALSAAYRASPWGRGRATVIFGCLKDKDAAAMVRALKPLARRVFLVPLPTPRSRRPAELRPLWRGVETFVAADAKSAWAAARKEEETVLVTGSLYLVGEAMKSLRRIPG